MSNKIKVEIKDGKIFSILNSRWVKLTQMEKLRQEFICRLINTYEYSPNQLGEDVEINDTLIADVAIWKNTESKSQKQNPDIYVLVICKAEHIRIRSDEYFECYKQATLSKLNFYVAHNLKETKVFYIDKATRPFKVERVGDFPKASDISSNSNLKSFVKRMRSYSKDTLLQALNRCHNIIRNIDKLSPESAFDEISKVLFIKMLYEKKSTDELIYTTEKFERDEQDYNSKHKDNYIQHLFSCVKECYSKDGLFDLKENIRIKRESFLMIIKELESIDLYDTSEDIKGVAFESFLGKTFRGELGQFFTPRTIVDYMVEVLDIKEGDLVCDPCCGSGGFLIKAFEHVQDIIDRDIKAQIEEINISPLTHLQKEEKINKILKECDKSVENSRYYKLCHNYFFGVDANSRMARTAKMNMIMHGDGHVGVYLHDGLINVGGIFEDRFDIVLINPPFGARVEKSMKITQSDMPADKEIVEYTAQFGDQYREKVLLPLMANISHRNSDGTLGIPIIETFDINNSNAEILFIERCIRLLKPGGKAGIVLPEGVLNNSQLEKVRSFVETKAKILNITSIPADVFMASGAYIKPSLIFIQKYTSEEDIIRHKELNQNNYYLSVTKVTDAGISSIGLPSDNNQLPIASKEVLSWIKSSNNGSGIYTKIIKRNDIINWSVLSCFENNKITFNSKYPLVKIEDVLSPNNNVIQIEDDIEYMRLTVRLFNKGIFLRDRVLGSQIGTKRQTVVTAGQFVISKIDGKSGAFGFIPKEYDGAIVTPDFMTFNFDKKQLLPEFLELVMNNKGFLIQFENASSGTTGRKRLSNKVFMSTYIPLPAIDIQLEMVNQILVLRKQRDEIEREINSHIAKFEEEIYIQ